MPCYWSYVPVMNYDDPRDGGDAVCARQCRYGRVNYAIHGYSNRSELFAFKYGSERKSEQEVNDLEAINARL